jgi:hypothetical protein
VSKVVPEAQDGWQPPRLEADLFHTVPGWLNELRTRGNDLTRARDWRGLWEARDELATDDWFWPDLWGPYCAIAGRRLGEPAALGMLEELVDEGFSQPELLGGELEAAFGSDAAWPGIAAAMSAPVAAPWLELTAWPVAAPARPIHLFALDEGRADVLRRLLPETPRGAWATARTLLAWVSERWEHADANMEIDDAVACLERVDAGERFACVEYALVLSQALNAVGIPARRLLMRRARYHVGLGRSHVVSEAWVDDLGQWVLLDAQNGLYWADSSDRPLSAPELQASLASGGSVIQAADAADGREFTDADHAYLRSYFASISTTGGTWATGGFVPIFQRVGAVLAEPLLDRPDTLYPDLGELEASVLIRDGVPVVALRSLHPYVTGFAVRDRATGRRTIVNLTDAVVPLPLDAGDHEFDLAAMTPHGELRHHLLAYSVRAG